MSSISSTANEGRYVDFEPDELALASLLRKVLMPVTDRTQAAEVVVRQLRARPAPHRHTRFRQLFLTRRWGWAASMAAACLAAAILFLLPLTGRPVLADTIRHLRGAESLLISGYQGLKQREDKMPVPAKIRITEALDGLIQLYDDWGKPEEAQKWQKFLDETIAEQEAKDEDKREGIREEDAPKNGPED